MTGPVLLFDEALFGFAEKSDSIDFLAWRVWVGIWLVIIALLVACFQGSVLVKFFTKFTKDIFAALVSLLFIFEAFNKLVKIFKAHPLQSVTSHCREFGSILVQNLDNESVINSFEPRESWAEQYSEANNETIFEFDFEVEEEPNTALLSAFLMITTFIIAYYLRIFRNGHFLGRTVSILFKKNLACAKCASSRNHYFFCGVLRPLLREKCLLFL